MKKSIANESLDELFRRSIDIRNGADFKKMLDFVWKFKEYKPFNNLLVYLQNPQCEYFATAKDWKKRFKRTIKPHARPLVILAPMTPVLFVYDIDATIGDTLPKFIEQPYTVFGQFDETHFFNLKSYFPGYNISLNEKPLSKQKGGCIYRKAQNSSAVIIELNSSQALAVNFATLIHELAHLLLGHLGSLDNENYPKRDNLTKPIEEIEAESVAYIVLNRLGLEGNAAEYLAFYSKNKTDFESISVDLIVKVASKIEAMATNIFKPKVNSQTRQISLFEN